MTSAEESKRTTNTGLWLCFFPMMWSHRSSEKRLQQLQPSWFVSGAVQTCRRTSPRCRGCVGYTYMEGARSGDSNTNRYLTWSIKCVTVKHLHRRLLSLNSSNIFGIDFWLPVLKKCRRSKTHFIWLSFSSEMFSQYLWEWTDSSQRTGTKWFFFNSPGNVALVSVCPISLRNIFTPNDRAFESNYFDLIGLFLAFSILPLIW